MQSIKNYWDNINRLSEEIENADCIVAGAGAGLSTAAGFTYAGERFQKYFSDFIEKYGFADMYSAGFYPYKTLEEFWAYWSRYILINRYMDVDNGVYGRLMELLRGKDYFVLTTNVDHQFQKTGCDKNRLFYTQGDYGLFQCSVPCHNQTYDNEQQIRRMTAEQKDMRIPSGLIPYCPKCGAPMAMNLRCDHTFVEDDGWRRASEQYAAFLKSRQNSHVLFLELGVGMNTPVIIKYPFWKLTAQNPNAVYACVNIENPSLPPEIARRSISIEGDIKTVLEQVE